MTAIAAATHHFRLTATGGSIEVTVKGHADQETIGSVRSHLRLMAGEFAAGQFDKPFQTHREVPLGVVEMQKSRRKIAYRYEDLPQFGSVRIETKDAAALDAVHAFLRYQFTEHHTGDPLQRER
jgi:hypothetical protein